MEKQRITIGNSSFALPLRASGFFVADAENKIVCECQTYAIAVDLASILSHA